MRLLRILGIVVLGLGVGVGAGVAIHRLVPESPYVGGLFIGGRQLPDGIAAGEWLAGYRPIVAERTVYVRYGDEIEEMTFGELGVDIDIEATLAKAGEIGHRGSVAERMAENLAAERGELDVPIVYRLSRPKMERVIERATERVKKAPKDARIDLANKLRIPDEDGMELDVDGSFRAIAEADYGKDGLVVVDLPAKIIRASVTEETLAGVDVTKVLSRYETVFSPYIVGRSANIERAAGLLDGVILPAGYTLSFNEVVGPRTLERGFHLAPEIQGDEMTTGVGGGTCQVSTTLFAAALHGALEIVDRKGHSQVSAYAKMGMDATVSFPSVDLKIKNNLTFPVMLHTTFPKKGTIAVEILGGDPVADVTYAYGVARAEDFVRRITVKSYLKPGTKIRRQKGGRGYDVSSIITIKWRDGRTEQRTYFTGYRPKPEVFWVSSDYNEADLPPLPEHAKGVEGRVAEGDRVYGDITTL
ncbi:MAG: vancomycin resistance protein [Polyangiaceae bacterium]|nr:vancomycin resistance protein [Polyangiaceae bacterium]